VRTPLGLLPVALIRGRSQQRAQALVEAALAIVPVLLAAVGLVQFALYLYAWHVLDAAVLEGARVASAQGRTLDDGVAYAQQLVRGGLGPSGYLDAPTIDGTSDADQVTLGS
jgi:Flp pilus assembly protein TadG